MILFTNGFFKLEYDASTDVLCMVLPDMRANVLSEAERCFEIMVEHVQNYHIQNLLLDSSKAVVEVGDTEYNKLIYRVSINLKQTRLKKVARIVSDNTQLEMNAILVQGEVLESLPPSYQIQNFKSRELALDWLTDKPFNPA